MTEEHDPIEQDDDVQDSALPATDESWAERDTDEAPANPEAEEPTA